MRAKSFFYVCAGILMLAVAYQLGATRAQAQLGGDFSGILMKNHDGTVVITGAGDIYARTAQIIDFDQDGVPTWSPINAGGDTGWHFMGNVLGGTVNAEQSTMTDVKSKYRDEEDE